MGAGLDAAQFHVLDALGVQGGLHPVQQAGADHGAAAVVDQHLVAAVLLHEFAGFVFGALAKDKVSGAVELKIFHNMTSCVFEMAAAWEQPATDHSAYF